MKGVGKRPSVGDLERAIDELADVLEVQPQAVLGRLYALVVRQRALEGLKKTKAGRERAARVRM